jgi:hypothetical protein
MSLGKLVDAHGTFRSPPSPRRSTEKDLIYDALKCFRFLFLEEPNATENRRPPETLEESKNFLSYSLKGNCKF